MLNDVMMNSQTIWFFFSGSHRVRFGKRKCETAARSSRFEGRHHTVSEDGGRLCICKAAGKKDWII